MKPKILISNDDSIHAKGLKSLVEVAKNYGDVIVVAPEQPQSAKSHSITLENPITYSKTSIFGDDIEAYYVSGTPADCIKFAFNTLLDHKVDLILSGINHGSNASVNLIYSGTVAAAVEGAMHDIPSIAFSIDTHNPDADFDAAKEIAHRVIGKVLENKSEQMCLNVNIPNIPISSIKGIKVCKQTRGAWFEEFMKIPHPSKSKEYYWLTGKYVNFEPENKETDIWALENNYVSIVPIKIDFTDYVTYEKIKNLDF